MNNDEAFLRAIADNPADDTLRLAYTNRLDAERTAVRPLADAVNLGI